MARKRVAGAGPRVERRCVTLKNWKRETSLLLVIAILPLVFLNGCAGIVNASKTVTTPTASFQVSSTSISFGNVSVGKATLQSLSVTNNGTVAVNITQATFSNSQFSLSGTTLPMALATGQAGTLPVSVDPTATGSVTGTLTLQGDGGSSPAVVNLSATAETSTYSISGTISGTGGNGATVTLSGASSATTTANSSGAYSFTGLANGSYTITPGHSGYTFSPSSQSATVNGANVTVPAFTATAVTTTYSISGTISGTGGNGATVTLSGASSATTTANSSGAYSFTGLANGSYAVTPNNSGYTFSPSSQSATVNGANVTVPAFTTTAVTTTYSVALQWDASTSTVVGYYVYRTTTSGTGYVKLNPSSAATGLSYTDTTVQDGTTYYYVTTAVDSGGTESLYSNEAQAIIP